uniref:CPXV018 protein n=1 Tax=Steinernema glaseri TaxID=37863 RepID=A0A1I7Y3N5_9BILA
MKLGSAIIFLFLLFRYSQAGLTYFRGTECDLDLFRDRSAYFFNRCGVVRIRIEQQTYTQFNEKVTELLSRPCNNSIDGNVKPFVYDEAKLLLVNYDRADHDIRTCFDDKDTFLYGAQEWRHLTRQLEYSEMEDKYIYKIDDNGEYACNPGGAFYDHCEKRLYMDLIFPWTSETRGNIKDNFNSVYEVNPDGNVVVRQTASILSECKKKSEITDWLIDYTWTSNKDLGQFFNQLYDGVSLKAMKK